MMLQAPTTTFYRFILLLVCESKGLPRWGREANLRREMSWFFYLITRGRK
jgi:hypothetical protein